MEQPIPQDVVRAALYPFALEKENSILRVQVAATQLDAEARVLFAKHGLELADWQIDAKTGTIMKTIKTPAPAVERPG